MYHDSHMANVLKDALYLTNAEDFHPGKFLKEKILDEVTSIQILMFGNLLEEEARDFGQKQIVDRFKLVEEHPEETKGSPLYIANSDP